MALVIVFLEPVKASEEIKEELKPEEVKDVMMEELKLEDDDEEEEEVEKELLSPGPRRSVTEVEPEEEEEEKEVEEEVVEVQRRMSYTEDHHFKILEECRLNAVMRRESLKKAKPIRPKDVESHFMEIGLLLKKECFGLGK